MKHAATKNSCMFILSGSSFSTARIKSSLSEKRELHYLLFNCFRTKTENPIHFRLPYALNQTRLKFYYIYICLFVFKGKAPIIFSTIFLNRFYGSDIVFSTDNCNRSIPCSLAIQHSCRTISPAYPFLLSDGLTLYPQLPKSFRKSFN